MSKLHGHVAQSAETNHADFLAFSDTPAEHGRVSCDSSAEQRSDSSEVQIGGDAQNEPLVHYNALGVAAVGDASEVLVRHIKGECEVRAELLEASPALGTRAVRVDHAA